MNLPFQTGQSIIFPSLDVSSHQTCTYIVLTTRKHSFQHRQLRHLCFREKNILYFRFQREIKYSQVQSGFKFYQYDLEVCHWFHHILQAKLLFQALLEFLKNLLQDKPCKKSFSITMEYLDLVDEIYRQVNQVCTYVFT